MGLLSGSPRITKAGRVWPISEIVGVASIEGKIPVVFSLNGYSEAALEVGRRGRAALFTYSFEQGTLQAASPLGERALKLGLLSLTI